MCLCIQNDPQFILDKSMTLQVVMTGRKSCSLPCNLNHEVLNLLEVEKSSLDVNVFSPRTCKEVEHFISTSPCPQIYHYGLILLKCVPLFFMHALDFSVEMFNTSYSPTLMCHIFKVPYIIMPKILILTVCCKSQKLAALADYSIS